MFKSIFRFLVSLGINPKIVRANLKGRPYFRRDLREIRKQLASNTDFKISSLYPVYRDRFESNGDLKDHYFHEDLVVAQRVFENKPVKHVDVGSRVDGFVAHIATFREIEVFDIRPQQVVVKNMKFVTADFMNVAPDLHDYTDSLSSLNVIEHFGLGRYGDPIDVDGHLKGLDSMRKVLKAGGKFYFSTPIGPQRIEFNAHRVFSVAYLLKIFEPDYAIDKFSYVDDRGDLHRDVALNKGGIETNFGCRFGFGIFEMTKR
jgi:SAM-dependent methyltransferase